MKRKYLIFENSFTEGFFPLLGSTEHLIYIVQNQNNSDWAYVKLISEQCIELRHHINASVPSGSLINRPKCNNKENVAVLNIGFLDLRKLKEL